MLLMEEDGDDESIMAVVLMLTPRRGRLTTEKDRLLLELMQEGLTELRKAATVSRVESIERPITNRVTSRR